MLTHAKLFSATKLLRMFKKRWSVRGRSHRGLTIRDEVNVTAPESSKYIREAATVRRFSMPKKVWVYLTRSKVKACLFPYQLTAVEDPSESHKDESEDKKIARAFEVHSELVDHIFAIARVLVDYKVSPQAAEIILLVIPLSQASQVAIYFCWLSCSRPPMK